MNDSTLSSKARMPDPQKPPNFAKAKRIIEAKKINHTKKYDLHNKSSKDKLY